MGINSVNLSKVKSKSPLANLANECLERSDIRKAKMISHLIDGFHLKNTVTSNVSGRVVTINGKNVINFGSVNYLGLEQHPQVIEASQMALEKWGNHSGCSRMFSSHENVFKLEESLAKLVGSEKTLICPNTAQTHLAVIPTLFSNTDSHIFIDRHAHMSMYQASLVAKAKGAFLKRVDSNNLEDLKESLRNSEVKNKVLLIDGLYSMQGTLPQIPQIQKICDETNTILYIDDAHGIALYGETGGGVREHFDLNFDNMILTGTLQKGLGSYGGFVAGKSQLIDILRVSSVAYIFSGTIQPHAVEGALAAIEICRSSEGRVLREKVFDLSSMLRRELKDIPYDVGIGESPIIPVKSGGDIKTLLAGRFFYDEGIFLNSVLYPAVPKDEGILRVSMTALHSKSDCEKLVDAAVKFKKYLKTFGFNSMKTLKYTEELISGQARRLTTLGTENSI